MATAQTTAKRRRRVSVVVGGFAAALLLLAGCGNEAAQQLIDKAKADRATGDLRAATIELKKALQKEPKNLAARLLLAETCIDISDGATAEAQVLVAQHDGASPLQTLKPLVEAELLEQKFNDILQQTMQLPEAAPADLKAELLALRATALLRLGQIDDARETLSQSRALDAGSLQLMIASARLAISDRDRAAAQRWLDAAQAAAPKDLSLLSLEGDLDYEFQDYAAAERAYQGRLDAQPWNDVARSDVALAQLAGNRAKAAIENLDKVLKDVPKDPNVNYLRALAGYRANDFASAQSYALAVLGLLRDSPAADLLVGASSYALHQYEQANKYLGPYVHRFPQNLQARKLLGAVQMALGRPGQAEATLSPALGNATEDAQLLALIGLAAARNGDLASANRYLEQAAKQQPDNTAIRSELGATQIALGKMQAGIADFEAAIQANPKDLGPQLRLFLAYMRTNDYDQALATAERVQHNLPKDPAGWDMAGVAELAKGDIKDGRAAFMRALELSPADANANRNLAKLAIADGEVDVARQHYQTILRTEPKNTPVYIDLAGLEDGLGHTEAAETALQTAVQQDPDDALAHAALAKFELAKGKFQAALNAVLPALDKLPRSPVLLEAAGRARLALGQTGDAISNFKTLIDVLPNAGWTHVLLADAFATDGIATSAMNQAQEALKIDPNDASAKRLLVRELLIQRQPEAARKIVEDLKRSDPDDVAVSELDAAVAQAQGRLEDGIAALKRAIAVHDNRADRTRLAQFQAAAGHTEDAAKTVAAWLAAHPQDRDARKLFADLSLTNNHLADASAQYAQLLKANPKDAVVLNNLAWTLSLMDRPKEALAYARDAVALDATSADNLDTLGAILLQNGIAGEATDALNKAWQKAPNRTDIQFHLAQAFARAGRTSDALDVLRGMLVRIQSFKERNEAQQLLQQLGGG